MREANGYHYRYSHLPALRLRYFVAAVFVFGRQEILKLLDSESSAATQVTVDPSGSFCLNIQWLM